MSAYQFEPSQLEVWLTACVGQTLLKSYYVNFIESLDIAESDRILDYGCGSGILTQRIAKELKTGKMTYVDVSKVWLKVTKRRLRAYDDSEGFKIDDFNDRIGSGEYDKIIVHFTLHDFPKIYLKQIIQHLVKHLHPQGRLIIREPIGQKHGLPLHEIYKALDSNKDITLSYALHHHKYMGDYADIVCRIKFKKERENTL